MKRWRSCASGWRRKHDRWLHAPHSPTPLFRSKNTSTVSQKVAIVLLALGPENAARVWELLDDEDMRVEFRRRKYDNYGSQFTDGGLFSMILAEFIRGTISGSIYWDRLDPGHRRARRSGSRGGGFRTGGGF